MIDQDYQERLIQAYARRERTPARRFGALIAKGLRFACLAALQLIFFTRARIRAGFNLVLRISLLPLALAAIITFGVLISVDKTASRPAPNVRALLGAFWADKPLIPRRVDSMEKPQSLFEPLSSSAIEKDDTWPVAPAINVLQVPPKKKILRVARRREKAPKSTHHSRLGTLPIRTTRKSTKGLPESRHRLLQRRILHTRSTAAVNAAAFSASTRVASESKQVRQKPFARFERWRTNKRA